MSATGRSDVRRTDDFYSTPSWCTEALARVFEFGPSCLDPCAGAGAIMRVVGRTGTEVHGLELDEERALFSKSTCCDSLAQPEWPRTYSIVTNPPYSLAMEFVTKALAQKPEGGVAMLLRLNWLASRKRADFHRRHPADVYVLPRRPSFSADGKTDATEYAWFVWGGAWAGASSHGSHWAVLEMS